jgi:hypothetical protein
MMSRAGFIGAGDANREESVAMPESFGTLFYSAAHWEFELFLMLLFDVVLAGLIWPFVRKHWKHHLDRDREEKYSMILSTPVVRPDPWDDLVVEQSQNWSGFAPGHTSSTSGVPSESWPAQQTVLDEKYCEDCDNPHLGPRC